MTKIISRILTGALSLALAGQMMFYGNETHITTSFAETVEEVSGKALSKETSEYVEQYGEYIGDPALEAYVSKKQELAEKLYQAIISENDNLVYQYQTEMQMMEYKALGTAQQSAELTKGEKSSPYPPPPSSYTISNFNHYPQSYSNYCGSATAYMILKAKGVNSVTQDSLANGDLKINIYNETPWYITNGNSFSEFPMFNALNNAQCSKYYIPSPLGNAGSNPLSVDNCKAYIVSCTSYGNGVALCGTSKASSSHASHMPGYTTAYDVGHWVACYGYTSNGSNVKIADPISGCSAISWSSGVSATYYITAEKCQAFIAPKGMLW